MLKIARAAASRYLAQRGYDAEARAVLEGHGDDFSEVRIAVEILAQQDSRSQRIEQALAIYADAAFWADDGANPAEAAMDEGNLARHALAGTIPPGRYHD